MMEADKDGWIEWPGGKCPVDENAMVDIRFANGQESHGQQPAKAWGWDRPEGNGEGYDIVAYRLHQAASAVETGPLEDDFGVVAGSLGSRQDGPAVDAQGVFISHDEYAEMSAKAAKYDAINTPEISAFLQAVENEALHQRERWGSEHDAGKTDADWFWLIGYLAGKAIRPDQALEKMLHHIITTAAACLNWHAARIGSHNAMRPGIGPDQQPPKPAAPDAHITDGEGSGVLE